jgi:hypothetical protein
MYTVPCQWIPFTPISPEETGMERQRMGLRGFLRLRQTFSAPTTLGTGYTDEVHS